MNPKLRTNAHRMGAALLLAFAGCDGSSPTDGGNPSPSPSGEPFFFDSFEAEVDQNGVRKGSPTDANGFEWGSSQGHVGFNDQNPRSGKYAMNLRHAPDQGNGESYAEKRFDIGRNLTEVWVEQYLWIPANRPEINSFQDYYHRDNPGHADNNKWFRLWMGGDDGEFWLLLMCNNGPTPGSSQFQTRFSGGGSGHNVENTEFVDVQAFIGQWVRLRVHARTATNPGDSDGLIEMWWNDHKFVDRPDVEMHGGATNYFRAGQFMGWHNSGYDAQVKFYVDDVAFYDSDPKW